MSANDPRNPQPNIQMTPVKFSPVSSADAVGNAPRAAQPPPRQFSIAIPLAILLVTLIISTGRDMLVVNKRMAAINEENAPALEILQNASKSKQLEFVDSLKAGVMKLAPTDPIAAQIGREFFPVKPAPVKPDAAAAKNAAAPAADK